MSKAHKAIGLTLFYLSVVFFSVLLSDFINFGDFKIYEKSFNDHSQSFEDYQLYMGVNEPIPFLLFRLGNLLGISFVYLNAFLNALFLLAAYKFFFTFRKENVGNFVLFCIVFVVSFYSAVLFFAAIRVKIALIFILFSYHYFSVSRTRFYMFSIMGLLSHFQSIFFIPIPFLFQKRVNKLMVISISAITFFVFVFYLELLLNRVSAYIGSSVYIGNFIKVLFLLSLGYLISERRINKVLYFLYSLLLLTFALFADGGRIAQIAWLLVTFSFLMTHRYRFTFYMLTLYFVINSLVFYLFLLDNGYPMHPDNTILNYFFRGDV